MTIYYSLTFLLLAAEMVTFCFLVSPLPYTVRKKVFRFLSESPVVAKAAYGLKISFLFVGILFLDALQRMYRITAESDMAKTGSGQGSWTHHLHAVSQFYFSESHHVPSAYLWANYGAANMFSKGTSCGCHWHVHEAPTIARTSNTMHLRRSITDGLNLRLLTSSPEKCRLNVGCIICTNLRLNVTTVTCADF